MLSMFRNTPSTPSSSRWILVGTTYSNEDQEHLSAKYPSMQKVDAHTLSSILECRERWIATLTPSTKSVFRVLCQDTEFSIALDICTLENDRVIVVQSIYREPGHYPVSTRRHECKSSMLDGVRTLPNVCMQFSYNVIHRMTLSKDDYKSIIESIIQTDSRISVVY